MAISCASSLCAVNAGDIGALVTGGLCRNMLDRGSLALLPDLRVH